jgi:subtilisin family serine protease
MRRLRRGAALALAGVAAAALLGTPGGSGSDSADPMKPAPSSWRGLVGAPRPAVAVGQRVLVMLRARSLAERVTAAGGFATDLQERQWNAAAFAAQQQVISDLAASGVRIRPEHRFTRVLNGFSAPVDPAAVAVLERRPEIEGVYPVRASYPASVARSLLRERARTESLAPASHVALGAYDGRGVTIALLDTGVDPRVPYLHGHVLDGLDVVGAGADARPHVNPDDPDEVERHGTEMAGLLVGSGGPAGLEGVAPGATLLPIRTAGWQRDARGRYAVYARTDQLLAALERAVDPNGDGDAHDAARVAVVPLAEPFAAFADGPLARAVAGALQLDMLVVAAAGNDGPAGPAFGNISGPGGAPAALTVGAADMRRAVREAPLVVRAGLDVLLRRRVPLAGAVGPAGEVSARLVAPAGDRLFDRHGLSVVGGRAVLMPAGVDPRLRAARAARSGAAAVLLYGSRLPAGGLGLDDELSVPVLGVPASLLGAVQEARAGGAQVSVVLGGERTDANGERGRASAFSSRGLAFGAQPKPELVAAGVELATAEPGAEAGKSRFVTVNGTSAAAALVGGAAALLVQARPELDGAAVRSLLAGTARPLRGEALSAQGAGLVDVTAAAAGELVTEPAALSFGRAAGDGWQAGRLLVVRNVSTRPLTVYVATPRRRRPRVVIELSARRLVIAPGARAHVTVRARIPSFSRGASAGGLLTLTPVGGISLRVPWAVVLEPPGRRLLGRLHLSTSGFRPSDAAPAVLAFQAGRVTRRPGGVELQPVVRLDVELRNAKRKRIGFLARVHHLLPGSYAFGLTGRGPAGRVLKPGAYRLRLTAWPAAGGPPSVRSVAFTIHE